MFYSTGETASLEQQVGLRLASTYCSPFALLLQAKRRLALDDSEHQSEPIRTPRGKGATANGTRIKAPRSKRLRQLNCTYLQPEAQRHHRSTRNTPTRVRHVTILCSYKNASCRRRVFLFFFSATSAVSVLC